MLKGFALPQADLQVHAVAGESGSQDAPSVRGFKADHILYQHQAWRVLHATAIASNTTQISLFDSWLIAHCLCCQASMQCMLLEPDCTSLIWRRCEASQCWVVALCGTEWRK